MEKHYAFLKNNRVTLLAVFDSENTEVADLVKLDHGFDSYVWINNSEKPYLYSSYDGTTFTPPTDEYLISIGVMNSPVEEPTE